MKIFGLDLPLSKRTTRCTLLTILVPGGGQGTVSLSEVYVVCSKVGGGPVCRWPFRTRVNDNQPDRSINNIIAVV